MKTITTTQIKNRLDNILSEYLAIDKELQDGLSRSSDFFDSDRYHDLTNKKAVLLTAHGKLTDALIAIEQYM